MRRRLLALLMPLALAAPPLATASHVSDFEREVPWGCARRDCIPRIDDPVFDDGGWLAPDDRVLGLQLGGVVRAYPVRILNWHEIVNDDVGGVPVVVTYCPLCGTGLTFERTLSVGVTSFGVSGRLYKNDLVMYDEATTSFWSQELGEAIWGDLHGERLRFVPTATTTWAEWKAAHPASLALARPDAYPAWRYDQYPYGDYETDARTLFEVTNPSNALHPKAWVLGVFTDNESIAFRREDVQREGAIVEPFDGRELLVVWTEGAPRARFRDTDEAPRQVLGFWFAWHDFHPDTRLWGRLLATIVLPREEGAPTRIVFSEAVDPHKVAPHLPPSVAVTWSDERVLELTGDTPFTIPPGVYGRNGTSLADPLVVPLGQVAGERRLPVAGVAAWVGMGVLVALFVAWRRAARRG